MAWTSQTGNDVASANLSLAVTAGDLIAVAHFIRDGTSNPTLSDGVNGYTQIGTTVRDATNARGIIWWWAIAATTTTLAVVISNTSATYCTDGATFRNGILSSPLRSSTGQVSAGVVAADGVTSTNIATTTAGDLVLGYAVNTTAFVANWASAGTGFTLLAAASSQDGVTNSRVTGYNLNGAGGALPATFTPITTDTYICVGAAFIPGGAGGGGGGPPQLGRSIYVMP